MRLLKFNNEFVDIDDKTAIGITLQAYDVKTPGERKVNTSNSFTIPKTSRNMRLIGNAGDVQFKSTAVYDTLSCEYYIDSYRAINKGRVMVNDVGERISLRIYEKETFWDLMKEFLWGDFQRDFLIWLYVNKSIPSISNPFNGSYSDFIDLFTNTIDGIILPYTQSNLAKYDVGGSFLEDTNEIYLKYESGSVDSLGGHFGIYIKTIFEYIEETYDVDFGVNKTFDYNIFQDVYGSVLYTMARNYTVVKNAGGYYIDYNEKRFEPYDKTVSYESKSLYDCVRGYFQVFNCLIDKESLIKTNSPYMVRRFDDIVNADVEDFSDNYEINTRKFYPSVKNYRQQNYIKFSKIYKDGDSLNNSKKITSLNKNLEAGNTETSLFRIDGFVNSLIGVGANLTEEESFETFSFFINSNTRFVDVSTVFDGTKETSNKELNVAEMYGINGEYQTLDSMLDYPVRYTIRKWLSLNDIENLKYFKKYFVRELNGIYFLSKVSGYNPDKSEKSTTLEFIKIP